jgi:hypothetical protein
MLLEQYPHNVEPVDDPAVKAALAEIVPLYQQQDGTTVPLPGTEENTVFGVEFVS